MSKQTLTFDDQPDPVLDEVLEIAPPASRMVLDARLAELADAAVLKIAPEKGPGSSPGAGTTLDRAEATAVRPVEVGDVVDVQDGELEERWRIVPHVEADAVRRCISDQSPLGRALLGHRAGEVVSVRPPAVHGVRGPEWPVTILAVKPAGPSE